MFNIIAYQLLMLFQKIVFVLGFYEFLAMLEGKIGVTPLIQDLDYAKKTTYLWSF